MNASMWGTVYVIRAGNTYKIGYTNGSAAQRLRALQVGSPIKLHLFCEIPHPSPARFERELAERYQKRLIHGEWYRLNRHDIYDLQVAEATWRRQYIDLQVAEAAEFARTGI